MADNNIFEMGGAQSDEDNWKGVTNIYGRTELLELGPYYSNMFLKDIKHIAFTLSRYKFVSKLLMYKNEVTLLELGCQEALGALMFKQNVRLKKYTGVDLDEKAISWNKKHLPSEFEFICANFFNCIQLKERKYDAVISLDVIEHISADMEDKYCKVLARSIKDSGVAVVGTPSVMMTPYACEESRVGHINLYDQKRLYALLRKHFNNVFIFNMNDEVVNTGFAPMSCYIFAVCCSKR